jgi:hypothetical protein
MKEPLIDRADGSRRSPRPVPQVLRSRTAKYRCRNSADRRESRGRDAEPLDGDVEGLAEVGPSAGDEWHREIFGPVRPDLDPRAIGKGSILPEASASPNRGAVLLGRIDRDH